MDRGYKFASRFRPSRGQNQLADISISTFPTVFRRITIQTEDSINDKTNSE